MPAGIAIDQKEGPGFKTARAEFAGGEWDGHPAKSRHDRQIKTKPGENADAAHIRPAYDKSSRRG